MLSYEETKCLDGLTSVYRELSDIIGDGPSRPGDIAEVVFHIHALQNMILAQSAAREYPEMYRLMGE